MTSREDFHWTDESKKLNSGNLESKKKSLLSVCPKHNQHPFFRCPLCLEELRNKTIIPETNWIKIEGEDSLPKDDDDDALVLFAEWDLKINKIFKKEFGEWRHIKNKYLRPVDCYFNYYCFLTPPKQ